MALWGNKDNIGSAEGTVGLNYATKVVTGSGTTFGDTDSIQVGDVIVISPKCHVSTSVKDSCANEYL